MVTRIPAPGASAAGATASRLRKVGAQAPDAARKAASMVQKNVRRAATGMLGLSGERMSKVDTAWLRMDSASNLMMINGVWTLSPGIGWEALCERVQQRLLQYPRFRQRVVEDAAGATWVEDRGFDIAAHVLRETLPRKAGQSMQRALQDRVGELAMQPLDGRRPLWQLHLIENFVGDDGQKGSALIVRIHHCIADGIALISVTMSLVDGGAEPPRRQRSPRDQAATAEDWIADALIKPFTGLTVKALDLAGDSAARSLQMLGDPEKAMHNGLAGTMDMAKMAYQFMSDAAALALMPDDSPTRLKGQPGSAKRVAWCPPIPLDDVKAIGRALNCSINDVLLSCVAGAIGGYLRSQGDDPTGQEIRAMIPVNLRPMEEAWKLGNRFGLVPLVLPIGVANPIERVYEVRKRMAALKGSTQPILAFAMLAVAGLMVKPAQDALLNLFGRKTTAVMTNVPGPKEALTLCGARVTQCMFWVPQSGDIGLGVSILSYGGGVQFGVITDTTLCPEPQQIIDAFAPEFEQLSLLTLMLPWGDLTAGALRAARPRAPRRWAAAVLLCCTGAAHAAVEEDSTHRPYPVQVRPGESLRAALHAATPISVGGQRFHGYTRWDVRWSFRWWREASGRCAITEVTTRLRTEVQLPELRGAGAAQQAAFDRYLKALSQHEQGHVQIGRDAAQAIDQALRQMPAAPDCATLERDANAVAQRLLRDHVEREKQYDVRTRHGASQGARLD